MGDATPHSIYVPERPSKPPAQVFHTRSLLTMQAAASARAQGLSNAVPNKAPPNTSDDDVSSHDKVINLSLGWDAPAWCWQSMVSFTVHHPRAGTIPLVSDSPSASHTA